MISAAGSKVIRRRVGRIVPAGCCGTDHRIETNEPLGEVALLVAFKLDLRGAL